MPPGAAAVKSPFSHFWPSQKDRNRRRAAIIDFDAVRSRRSPHNDISLRAHLVLIELKPFRVSSAQYDRDTHRRMIVKFLVVRSEESVQINIEGGMVAAQFPAMEVWGTGDIVNDPRRRILSHVIQHTSSQCQN